MQYASHHTYNQYEPNLRKRFEKWEVGYGGKPKYCRDEIRVLADKKQFERITL